MKPRSLAPCSFNDRVGVELRRPLYAYLDPGLAAW